MTHDMPAALLTLAILIFVGLGYFLPSIVASRRGHQHAMAIGLMNFLAGWTLVGWVIALIWACTATGRREEDDAVIIFCPHCRRSIR